MENKSSKQPKGPFSSSSSSAASSSSSYSSSSSLLSSSSYSLATDLFGPKTSSPSTSIFSSVFGSSSTGRRGGSWHPQQYPDRNSNYQKEGSQACHYSSSIYYGGQDVYDPPARDTQQNEGPSDGGASRGDWWQGSLYY